MPRNPRRWTPQEDRILLAKGGQLFSEGEKTETTISWSAVSNAIPNRNNKDCRKRWYKLSGAKKGLWAATEDERLLQGVQKYGSQWTQVAKTVETRNADQCAKRWQHCLDPSLDHSEWTTEKDAQLIAAVERYGTIWKDIKKFEFPMRSTTNLKNRHIALLRRSNKKPNSPGEAETLEPSMEWLSMDREIPETLVMDGSEDSNYLESDQTESPYTIASPSSFRKSLTLENSPSVPLAAGTTRPFLDSDLYHLPLEWELPANTSVGQTTAPAYYADFDPFPEPTLNHGTDAGSTLWEDINNYEASVQELYTLPVTVPISRHANSASSQAFDAGLSAEGSRQESSEQPQSVGSNTSSDVPKMVLTIDNPDPQAMTSILEVLTRVKSKVTISINS